VLDLPTGIRDIVVAEVDLQQRAGDAQVSDPDERLCKRIGEGECRLIRFIRPVVDGVAPAKGARRGITDGSWVLTRMVDIDDAMRRCLGVLEEIQHQWV
jgi:hypothetical protein